MRPKVLKSKTDRVKAWASDSAGGVISNPAVHDFFNAVGPVEYFRLMLHRIPEVARTASFEKRSRRDVGRRRE
jgi:hypothetical protein